MSITQKVLNGSKYVLNQSRNCHRSNVKHLRSPQPLLSTRLLWQKDDVWGRRGNRHGTSRTPRCRCHTSTCQLVQVRSPCSTVNNEVSRPEKHQQQFYSSQDWDQVLHLPLAALSVIVARWEAVPHVWNSVSLWSALCYEWHYLKETAGKRNILDRSSHPSRSRGGMAPEIYASSTTVTFECPSMSAFLFLVCLPWIVQRTEQHTVVMKVLYWFRSFKNCTCSKYFSVSIPMHKAHSP